MLECQYPADRFEVLAVDGMSNDGTFEIGYELTKRYSQLHVLRNPKRTTPAALNIGIRASRGDVIVRMDAHAHYPKGYLCSAVRALEATKAWVVGGPIVTVAKRTSAVARALALATSHPFGVGNSRFRTSKASGPVDTVPFGAYRRSVFSSVGLFDEALERNQDNEFSTRIRSAGGTIYMTPDLTAEYFSRLTLAALLRQSFRTGMWNVATIRRNPRAFSPRHFVPFVFVSSLIVFSASAAFAPAAQIVLGLIVFAHIALSAMFATAIGLRERDWSSTLLPFVFLSYHLSYGLGTFGGVLRALTTGWPRRSEIPSLT